MIDQYGRNIDYMRVSVTDRCNLRCKYCMPDGIQLASHSDILTYEELLRLCRIAVSLGIVKFKVTGGEPLLRRGCTDFIARLKSAPGVEQVTITTNGLLLHSYVDELCAAGIDGINISLDTLCDRKYIELTGCSGGTTQYIVQALKACAARGIRAKVNTVLLDQTYEDVPGVAMLAAEMPIDVRFIELMPIGEGAAMEGVSAEDALERLKIIWPDLYPVDEQRGNGPARYYNAFGLKGRVGFINAVSHQFCGSCNRVRLTGTGSLKPCLCYEEGTDLRALLRSGCAENALEDAMAMCIWQKPIAHCFSSRCHITEHKAMHQIGG